MANLFTEQERTSIFARLDKLQPDMKPRWGRMNASQMLAHLGDSVRMALGEIPTKRHPLSVLLSRGPLKYLIVHVLPLPKSAPAAPEIINRSADDWNAERESIRALLQRFLDAPDDHPLGEHFVFGRLTPKQWGLLGYKHFDHHLRQFGV